MSQLTAFCDCGLRQIELGPGFCVKYQVLSSLTDLGCRFLMHNYIPQRDKSFVLNLASSDNSIRHRSVEFVREAIDLCAELMAPFYSIHAGFITDPIGFNSSSFIFPMPDSPDEEKKALDHFISSLDKCVAYAGSVGIRILVENNVCTPDLQGKLLLQTGEEFRELFAALPSSNLKILLDTGHLNVSAQTCGFDKMKFVDDVAHFIGAFHVHENNGHADFHLPVQPGSWILNVLRKELFATVPVIIESKFTHLMELKFHVEWMKREFSIPLDPS